MTTQKVRESGCLALASEKPNARIEELGESHGNVLARVQVALEMLFFPTHQNPPSIVAQVGAFAHSATVHGCSTVDSDPTLYDTQREITVGPQGIQMVPEWKCCFAVDHDELCAGIENTLAYGWMALLANSGSLNPGIIAMSTFALVAFKKSTCLT